MHTLKYKIKEEDINLGNHVGNERALLFFQYSRSDFLKKFGLSQLNLGDNSGLIQVNAFVNYKAQLYLDEEINIKITNIKVEGLKLIFDYEIYKADEILAIDGYTTLLCYDYENKKVKKIPTTFLEILEKLA